MRYLLQHDHLVLPCHSLRSSSAPPGAARHGCHLELLRRPARLAPGGGAATGRGKAREAASQTPTACSAYCPSWLPPRAPAAAGAGVAAGERRPARLTLITVGAATDMGPEVIMPPEFRCEVMLRRMCASVRGPEREMALGSSCGSRKKLDERIRRSGRHLSLTAASYFSNCIGRSL
jgi:hypothetical protein